MTKPITPNDGMQFEGAALLAFFKKLFRLKDEVDYLNDLQATRQLIQSGKFGKLWWSVTWRERKVYQDSRFFAEVKRHVRDYSVSHFFRGMGLGSGGDEGEAEALVRALIDYKLRARQYNLQQWQEKRAKARRPDVFGGHGSR